MTTRRATVLSAVGVLVAGLIAALVNTQALAGGNGRGDGLLASPQPVATVPIGTAAPTSAADPATTVAVTAPATVLHSFAAGSAGTVTLDGSSGALVVVAVLPADGWLVSSVNSDGVAQVVVAFTSMTQRLVATAVLADGEVAMTVTTETAAAAPPVEPPTAGEPAPGTTAPRPVSTDPQPTATTSATTTTVEHEDDDHTEDHSGESGGDDSGEDHEEPDD